MTETPPADPKPEPPKPETPAKTAEQRFEAIETEQREQRGILTRIEAAITGGSPKSNGGSTDTAPGTGPGSPGLSVAEQVRRGVEEIEAKKQKDTDDQAAKDADSAWRKNVDERLAERRPAEPATGRKVKLARALFGKADER